MEFVGYHNRPKMGYPLEDVQGFAMLTSKSPFHLKGHHIWVVEGLGSPRQYYVRQRFLVDDVEASIVDGFDYRFYGTQGVKFDSDVSLRTFDWFSDFMKTVGNFGIGAQVLSEFVLSEFSSITGFDASFTLPGGVDAV